MEGVLDDDVLARRAARGRASRFYPVRRQVSSREQERDEQRHRQADDVRVVALDATRRAPRRGPGWRSRRRAPATRRPRRRRRPRPDEHGRKRTTVDRVPVSSRSPSRSVRPEHDDVLAPGEPRRASRARASRVGRLAEHPPVDHDLGVDAQHRPVAGPALDRAGLAAAVRLDQLARRERQRRLVVVRLDDAERQAELGRGWRGAAASARPARAGRPTPGCRSTPRQDRAPKTG